LSRFLRTAALALLGAAVLSGAPGAARRETGFLDRALRFAGREWRYQVYVPRAFDPGEEWPVVLFLHGSGERGTDGLRSTCQGVAQAIRIHPERFPLIAVFPQCPDDSVWIGQPADAALAALDQAMVEFHGDPRRVYLTGLSLGGYGTWHVAASHPGRFAALVPVCGGIVEPSAPHHVKASPLVRGAGDPYAAMAELVRGTPAWIFHGGDDPIIPAAESRRMSAALKALGSPETLTVYEKVGHGCWDDAYGEPGLWPWLLAQRLVPRDPK